MSATLASADPAIETNMQRARRSIWRSWARNRSAVIGTVVIVVLTVLSLAAPVLPVAGPNEMNMMTILAAPDRQHPFGTDDFGRDILSRVLHGGRLSILIGVSVALATTVLGLLVGTIAGYYRRVDNILMRCMDVLMAFPPILLAIGIMAILGSSLINIIVALVIPYTPITARLVRAEILHLREREFAEAARSLGMRDVQIMIRHLIPNSMAPLLVQQTFILALAILAESSLNFLGVGVPPDVPTLGGILSDARTFLRNAYWMALFPGVFIALLVLGFNILGDGMRDILDPYLND